MPILNYTTEVDAIKTAGQIQGLLAMKGAHSIAIDYADGEPTALVFRLALNGQDLAYRLPCNWQGVLQTMNRDSKCPPRYKTNAQAKRVAWRIVKDWIEAQLAIIESGQAQTSEVFLPYVVTDNGQTLFQRVMLDPSRLLGAGSSA